VGGVGEESAQTILARLLLVDHPVERLGEFGCLGALRRFKNPL